MPDLMIGEPWSTLGQELRHRKPNRNAIPLDFERENSSNNQIYACGRRSSAAC
jgi:hypothetical protein